MNIKNIFYKFYFNLFDNLKICIYLNIVEILVFNFMKWNSVVIKVIMFDCIILRKIIFIFIFYIIKFICIK